MADGSETGWHFDQVHPIPNDLQEKLSTLHAPELQWRVRSNTAKLRSVDIYRANQDAKSHEKDQFEMFPTLVCGL